MPATAPHLPSDALVRQMAGDIALELPLHHQAKLLRVLDAGRFYRLGEPKPRQSDVGWLPRPIGI